MEAIKAALWSLALAGAGCAPAVQGSVASAPLNGEAAIRIEDGSVAPGDGVLVCRQVCDPIVHREAPLSDACTREPVGRAHVTRLLGNDLALVQLDPGVLAREGDVVDKGESSRCAQ